MARQRRPAATPEKLVAAAFRRFGRLDGALVSVGGPPARPDQRHGREDWRQPFESIFLGG